jgi:heme exporter protein A
VAERLEEVGLLGRAGSRVRTFSRGMRQRLALARTLLHDPDVVFLDEPYTGLDAHAAGLLNEVLASLRDGRRTVVLVTHNLSKGLHLADRVAIQVRGRFAYDAGIDDLPDEAFEGFYRQVVDSVEAGR